MNTISKENQIRNDEYRKNIFNMVNDIENTDYLWKIYCYILPKYKREHAEDKKEGL